VQSVLYLVLGALSGSVIGWAIYAAYYVQVKRMGTTFGIRPLRDAVPEDFWHVSRYVCLIGALIGAAVVAIKEII
jgi:hypothetical protein